VSVEVRRVTALAAEAAEAVPGVAYLSPNLAGRLRGAAAGRGVHAVEPGPGAAHWRVEVALAVRAGHRASDVAREVRAAVGAAVGAGTGTDARAVRVQVTVTAIA
jgi:uncharacterized alkaline shock family protein YloU